MVNAVRRGDRKAVSAETARDPANVDTEVYPQAVRADDMGALLLTLGARVDAVGAHGKTALHVAADGGRLGGAVVLCRYGAGPARRDVAGRTPYDLSRLSIQKRDPRRARTDEEAMLTERLKPNGGCAIVAAGVRATGSAVSDDDARNVFGETVAISLSRDFHVTTSMD